MDKSSCHFGGYATRNDLPCADGRTIKRDAFKDCDGQTVPLIYQHMHNDPNAVLGHALLENRADGVYAYCTFNDSESGQTMKQAVQHGDIRSLSIYANKLKQIGTDVVHGCIRELSLVLAGANPGAYVDFIMAHGDDRDDDTNAVYANYDESALVIYHSDDEKKEEPEMADEKKTESEKDEEKSEGRKTVKEVFDDFTDEQLAAINMVIDKAVEDATKENKEESKEDEKSEGGKEDMKHNVFDKETDTNQGGYLSHSEQAEILALAKNSTVGSFKAALEIYADHNELKHDAVSGFAQTGEGNITTLFPEYHDVKPGAPELITDDQSWVGTVMSKVRKIPFSRIRTGQVDIRKIESLRARGYKKGNKKDVVGNYKLVRRTTDPQTIYVKSALHRDDIIDITDFDIVQYQYNIDRAQLDMELAQAILFGDGRDDGAEDKIAEDKIRPIWTDDDLYTMHHLIDFEEAKTRLQGTETDSYFGENYIMAEALIEKMLYAREKFKGTGTPDMYIDPHYVNVMLLSRDRNGRRIFSSISELAAALHVGKIITVEQMEDMTRVDGSDTKKLIALVVNLADYSLGATKGGKVAHFTQFDIDFNQQKSLLETRCSGALTKVYSALAIEEVVTA